jgi:hypothetical protein
MLRFEDGLILFKLALDARDHFGDALLVSLPIAGWQTGHTAAHRLRLEHPK